MRAAWLGLRVIGSFALIVLSLTSCSKDKNQLGRAAFDVRVPHALWDDIDHFDAQIWDSAAGCTMSGFGFIPGTASKENEAMFDKTTGQASFTLPATIHVFLVDGLRADGSLIARGCVRKTIDANSTTKIM